MFIEWPYKMIKSLQNLLKKSDEKIDIGECHIFYMRDTDDIEIKDFKSNGTLIISDNYDDIHEGCIISFYQDGKKIRFIINQKNLDDANLRLN